MNIFVLDRQPRRCARYHCDAHCVKMVLETAQILCTARHLAGDDTAPYRPTHTGHPCVLWAAATAANYGWLGRLGLALSAEFEWRFGHPHASAAVIGDCLEHPPPTFAERGRTPFAQAMPERYRQADPVAAYRDFYAGEKRAFAKWTRRRVPAWYRARLAAHALETPPHDA